MTPDLHEAIIQSTHQSLQSICGPLGLPTSTVTATTWSHVQKVIQVLGVRVATTYAAAMCCRKHNANNRPKTHAPTDWGFTKLAGATLLMHHIQKHAGDAIATAWHQRLSITPTVIRDMISRLNTEARQFVLDTWAVHNTICGQMTRAVVPPPPPPEYTAVSTTITFMTGPFVAWTYLKQEVSTLRRQYLNLLWPDHQVHTIMWTPTNPPVNGMMVSDGWGHVDFNNPVAPLTIAAYDKLKDATAATRFIQAPLQGVVGAVAHITVLETVPQKPLQIVIQTSPAAQKWFNPEVTAAKLTILPMWIFLDQTELIGIQHARALTENKTDTVPHLLVTFVETPKLPSARLLALSSIKNCAIVQITCSFLRRLTPEGVAAMGLDMAMAVTQACRYKWFGVADPYLNTPGRGLEASHNRAYNKSPLQIIMDVHYSRLAAHAYYMSSAAATLRIPALGTYNAAMNIYRAIMADPMYETHIRNLYEVSTVARERHSLTPLQSLLCFYDMANSVNMSQLLTQESELAAWNNMRFSLATAISELHTRMVFVDNDARDLMDNVSLHPYTQNTPYFSNPTTDIQMAIVSAVMTPLTFFRDLRVSTTTTTTTTGPPNDLTSIPANVRRLLTTAAITHKQTHTILKSLETGLNP
jgi:hypothetical protein